MSANGVDTGATWKTAAGDDSGNLSMKLDGIGVGEWVNAALAPVDGVHTLVWSRSAADAD